MSLSAKNSNSDLRLSDKFSGERYEEKSAGY